MVLKPYVHNVYMNQEGYSDIDYTKKKEYEEALMSCNLISNLTSSRLLLGLTH